jgi:hypothetical protein
MFVDLEREARIEEYTKRAARRQPLFETAFDSERMDLKSKGIEISRGINTLTYA